MMNKLIIGLLVLFLLSMPVACAQEMAPTSPPPPTSTPAPGSEPTPGASPRTYIEMIEPSAIRLVPILR